LNAIAGLVIASPLRSGRNTRYSVYGLSRFYSVGFELSIDASSSAGAAMIALQLNAIRQPPRGCLFGERGQLGANLLHHRRLDNLRQLNGPRRRNPWMDAARSKDNE
jgi:hypothetical protein